MDGFKNPEIVSNRLKDLRSLQERRYLKWPCFRLWRGAYKGAIEETLFGLAV